MSDINFDDVVKLADQLSPEEQQALLEHLQAKRKLPRRPPLDLLVFDVGPWPEGMTLRREDEYDDDGR